MSCWHNQDPLDWAVNEAFLYLGQPGHRDEVWPLYCAAMYARQEGERNYAAEERLLELMAREPRGEAVRLK
jgi:hypothetical protein